MINDCNIAHTILMIISIGAHALNWSQVIVFVSIYNATLGKIIAGNEQSFLYIPPDGVLLLLINYKICQNKILM